MIGRRRTLTAPAAAIVFLVLTVAMTWPLATDLSHLLPDNGDPYLTTWILHWDWMQMFRDPVHLFDAGIFFPCRLALAFSENLVGVAVFGFPLYAAGIHPVAVYNVLFLGGMALSGFGCWALARELIGEAGPALAAGIFYEFVPFRFDQVSHLQMQWGGFLPLFLLFLFRYFQRGRAKDLVAFALFFSWNALACVHYGVFGAMAIALFLIFSRGIADAPSGMRRYTGLGIALLASAIVIAPFYLPYAAAARLYQFQRSLDEMKFFSAEPKNFLSAGAHNKLYAAITARFQGPERQMFPGLIGPILALFAWIGLGGRKDDSPLPERPRSRARETFLRVLDSSLAVLLLLRVVLAVTGGIRIGRLLRVHESHRLSMMIFLLLLARLALAFPRRWKSANLAEFLRRHNGPPWLPWAAGMTALGVGVALGVHTFFYRALLDAFPFVLRAIRAPSRGIVLCHVGIAVLAARGLALGTSRLGKVARPAATACILALLCFELRAAPLDWRRYDTSPTATDRWLAGQKFAGGLLELPISTENDTGYLFHTMFHGHPILNGSSGFFPRSYLDLKAAFDARPISPEAFDRARSSLARVVVYHAALATAEEIPPLASFLQSEVRSGHLRVLAQFAGKEAHDLAFELTEPVDGARGAPLPAQPDARERFEAYLRAPDVPAVPPYGWFDGPGNGEVCAGGEIRGSGWAAAEGGIAGVDILLDDIPVGRATYGFPRPDVLAAKPRVPCAGFCGYRYRIAHVPRGLHVLTTRFIGRNGKSIDLPSVEVWVLRSDAANK